MRVATIVRRVLSHCSIEIHAARFTALLVVVTAIIEARRLCLTAVGRAIGGRAYAKHSIKRVDRLLSNPHIWADRWLIFAELTRRVVGSWKRPIVLVDWTKVTDGFHALAAAVPIGGRALCIYEEVHPERLLGNARVQAAFLRALRDMLPAGCRPSIVTDAGFYGPFFREVRRMGWDFVGRIRGDATMQLQDGRWTSAPALFAQATINPRDLATCRLYKEAPPLFCRLVLASSRHRRKKHPWAKHPHGAAASAITGAFEPWLLATSLDGRAAEVVAVYAKRMQIEETFRDAKNHRFGFCLRHVRGYSAARLTILLLLAVIAMLAVTFVGLVATARNLHRRYQANTVKKRVLAHAVLGSEVLRHGGHRHLGDVVAAGLALVHTALQQLDLAVSCG